MNLYDRYLCVLFICLTSCEIAVALLWPGGTKHIPGLFAQGGPLLLPEQH